jgi:hypothetical protein
LEYSKSHLVDLLGVVLESARIEVVRRMRARDLPLSFETEELRLVDTPQNTGWQAERKAVQVGGLDAETALLQISDRTVPLMTLGLRDQLTPLADYLVEATDLVSRRYSLVTGPDQSLVEVLLTRCISPLALYYLRSLRDLESNDHDLYLRLADDLDQLISSDVIVHVNQLPVKGIRPSAIYSHRGVSIRQLTPRERGSWVELNIPSRPNLIVRDSDYMPFTSFPQSTPSALIEITTTRATDQQFDTSQLPNRVALAFLLTGHNFGTPGFITNFDWPGWAALGRWNTPFPVAEQPHIINDVPISLTDFQMVVDLAYKMPDFSGREATRREIVLFRVLRALGGRSTDSAFLDLAIALEAAMLAGTKTELSYRFSLYGALFLRDELEPLETFRRLKNIYDVRSNLVHGGRTKSDANISANRDAPELSRAVTRKAIESGWPEPKLLDSLALSSKVVAT